MGLRMIKAQGGIFGWVTDSARILAALGRRRDRSQRASSADGGDKR